MIIVTVGMQLGFDRLIAAMDGLAPDLGMKVIAQTGNGTYGRATWKRAPESHPTNSKRWWQRPG